MLPAPSMHSHYGIFAAGRLTRVSLPYVNLVIRDTTPTDGSVNVEGRGQGGDDEGGGAGSEGKGEGEDENEGAGDHGAEGRGDQPGLEGQDHRGAKGRGARQREAARPTKRRRGGDGLEGIEAEPTAQSEHQVESESAPTPAPAPAMPSADGPRDAWVRLATKHRISLISLNTVDVVVGKQTTAMLAVLVGPVRFCNVSFGIGD